MNTYLVILTFVLLVSLVVVTIMYFRKPKTNVIDKPCSVAPEPKPCQLKEMGQLKGYSRYSPIGAFKDEKKRAVPFRKPNAYAPKDKDGTYKDRVFTCSMSCENYKYFAMQNNNESYAECRCTNDLEEAKKYGKQDPDTDPTCTPNGGPWCNYIYENKYVTECSR